MPFNCQPCLRFFHEIQRPTTPPVPPIPPRCILLGPTGAGKTTFLLQIRNGGPSAYPVQPTTGPTVEEFPISGSSSSLVFSDIGGSDRRELRLHFLHAVPILDLCILFFIDVTASLEELPNTLKDLAYAVTYARSRAGYGTKFVGVVLNKQDLLREDEIVRSGRVARITREVRGAMKEFVGKDGEAGLKWEVLDGGVEGISASTGVGVKDVLMTVVNAVFDGEVPGDAPAQAPVKVKVRDVATGVAGVAGELLSAVKEKVKP
ncbi:hypothetical protein BZA05DRAFT_389428 [Tricharina praecox]|uniref:uncharacterized protein n=1 Tax=Tricharina praecox TaxID=43433 RepID=UPI002220103F|nr:uncharacterized protein BZA05DRAFT_389428 [Tricharina praecox]KAI5855712.1 hypothetical protein BZA05DRAFT_389428 [Tricharina praecox]